jgi:hypothetical protein
MKTHPYNSAADTPARFGDVPVREQAINPLGQDTDMPGPRNKAPEVFAQFGNTADPYRWTCFLNIGVELFVRHVSSGQQMRKKAPRPQMPTQVSHPKFGHWGMRDHKGAVDRGDGYEEHSCVVLGGVGRDHVYVLQKMGANMPAYISVVNVGDYKWYPYPPRG